MAVPVVLVDAGARPVTAVESGGFPMTPVDTNGEPVTLVDAGGEPITLINEDGTPALLAFSAKSYLNGIAPYHWFDFINDRALYAGADVGAISNATGYSFSRASQGYYTNSDGTLTSFASGALRTGDRGVLIEGARTNILLRSTFEGGGAAPTGWSQPTATGTSAPVTSTLNSGIIAYEQTATAQRPYMAQTVTLASNTTYVFSVYIEAVTGTLALNQMMAVTSLPAGAIATEDSLGNLAAGQRRTITISGTYTGAATTFRTGLGTSSNVTGTVRFSAPQLEAGAFPSSYIPTTSTSATRAADVLTCTAGVSYPLTLWAEFERAVDTGGSVETIVAADAGSNTTQALLYVDSSDRGVGFLTNTSTQMICAVTGAIAINTTTKLAARFATDDGQAARGGTLATPDGAVTVPANPIIFRIGSRNGSEQPFGYISRAAIFSSALSDANLQSVTT